MVLKPAEEAPLTSLRIAELAMEAGIPPGVVNVVPGYGETAGAALASHHDVDKVAFTGSHVTGQSIIRASAGNLKRVSLELGGKSPDIVFADADLDAAVPGAAMAVFANSGQICSAGTRLFVEQSIYEEFVGRVAEFGKKLQVGNGLDPNTQIGPLVSEQQLERVTSYLDIGQKEGAQGARRRRPRHRRRAVEGLLRLADGVRGRPGQHAHRAGGDLRSGHLRDRVQGHGRAGQARQQHHLRPRLAACGRATSARRMRSRRRLRAGSVWVNCYQAMDPAVPFGGYKMSGYGREFGKQHVEEYLNVKAVWIKTA